MNAGGQPPADDPVNPLVTWVRYDDGVLGVLWVDKAANPARTYIMDVFSGSDIVAAVETGRGMGASLPVTLLVGTDYEVAVQVMIGPHIAAWSQRVPVTLDLVTIASAATDPATGDVTLTWNGSARDRFLFRLGINGAPPDPGSYVMGSSLVLSPAPQPPGCQAWASLAPVVDVAEATSVGQSGPTFALPTYRPDLLAVDFDGTVLQVAWSAVIGAAAYRMTILTPGSHAVFFQADVPAPTTSFEGNPGITDTTADYRVVVQAVFSTGTGPPSMPLTIVLAAPTLSAVSCDGRTLSIEVAPAAGAPPTAYKLTVSSDGVAQHQATLAPTSPLTVAVDWPVEAGAAHSVAVASSIDRTSGPAAAAPAVLATPAVVSIVCGTDLLVTAGAGSLAPAGVAIDARALSGGQPGPPQRVGADGTTRFGIPAGPAAVSVRGVIGVATGPWSTATPAPTTAPVILAAGVDDSRVDLVWTGAADAIFHVAVGVDGAAAGDVMVHGTSASLSLVARAPEAPSSEAPRPGAGGSWNTTINEVLGVASGPTTALALVVAGPRVDAVAMAAERAVTVTWTPPAAPPNLTAVVPTAYWEGGEVVFPALAPTTNPIGLTLPRQVPNGAVVALRAQAGVATGPIGEGGPLITVAPVDVTGAYNGAAVRVTWTPVTSALVTGYRVSAVVRGSATVLGDVSARSGTWPLDAAWSDDGAVFVQALVGDNTGAPSQPVPLFSEALFLGATETVRYLAPQRGPVLTASDITLSLPDLFGARPSGLPYTDVTLGVVLSAGSGLFPYELTIPASSPLWNFSSRINVVTAWIDFLKALENPKGLKATPFGIFALNEAVSRAMPQTFSESLYFAYGAQFDRGCFDLRPGMVVRVEYENYQTLPVMPDQATLSGFVTSAVADYQVATYPAQGRWLIGLDAFLGALAAQGVSVPIPPPPGPAPNRAFGGGGVIDAFPTTLQAPFLRVVYPSTYLPNDKAGSLSPEKNAVLLTGATFTAVELATDNVRRGNPPGGGVASVYFRGRTVIRPLVGVWINATPRLVPVGTTVGNLLASEARKPPAAPVALAGVSLRRARAAAVTGAAVTGDAAAWPVRLDWSPGNPAWLDLPVLHGDRLDLDPAP